MKEDQAEFIIVRFSVNWPINHAHANPARNLLTNDIQANIIFVLAQIVVYTIRIIISSDIVPRSAI